MKTKAIIFDLDKTLLSCDLPITIAKRWADEKIYHLKLLNSINKLIKFLPHRKLRRIFEYWFFSKITNELSEEIIKDLKSTKDIYNQLVHRRYIKYIKKNYKVFIITAGPESFARKFFIDDEVEVIGSKVKFFCIYKDLVGKKNKVYQKISSSGYEIISIYSDYIGDLSRYSKNNYLIKSGLIIKIKI
jgi:phosphoserine phosphatase